MHFTKEDAGIYKKAQYNALDNYKDGNKAAWSNPKTGAHGYFIPSKTRKDHGMTCRDLTIFNLLYNVLGLLESNFIGS